MAILSKDDYMRRLSERVGEDSSDESLTFVEDFTDTYNDMESRIGDDYKKKFEENDAAWRKKYKERFFTSPEKVEKETKEDVKDDGETKSFEELFNEKEG